MFKLQLKDKMIKHYVKTRKKRRMPNILFTKSIKKIEFQISSDLN